MTRTAVLFPGQGGQRPGMGRSFDDAWAATRERLDALEETTDVDLRERCYGSDAATLRATEHAQPAVYAVGVATWAGLVAEHDLTPVAVAGHSLGHWTALAAAGGIDDAEGLSLVTRRGRAMADAERAAGPGTMLAVLLADPVVVAEACDAVPGASVAAFNAPRQTVVSGTESAVATVRSAIAERSSSARFRELDVGGAFHSPVMEAATDTVGEAVDDARLRATEIPVVSDVSATAYTDPAVARRDLRAQVTAPVDWVGVLETLAARGVERFLEVPPAGTLTDLVEQTLPDATAVALTDPDDATGALA